MFRLFLIAVALAVANSNAHAQFAGNFQAAPADPAHQRIAQSFARGQIPQRIADHLNSVLQMPAPVLIQFQACGTENAFFSPRQRAVVFCYEMQQAIHKRVDWLASGAGASQGTARDMLDGALWFILLHEVGHAVHLVADLPTLGRREDVADQIAAWIAIRRPPPGVREPVVGGMAVFLNPQARTDYEAMGGPHSLDPQRLQNVACWAFGADPVRYRELPAIVGLPEARRTSCAEEWEAIDRAVPRLLGRALKAPKLTPW
ncbi:MAG: hypothetical protein DI561_15090 [Thauera sp.]|nr:MAG: hypothetical protein DI561_15090 [Thauera sp.]